ncbi:MAG TPA: hypothetical protein VFF58_00580 [Candidatus Nitrosotalea sp.]|nr:hypothetical protein [Candidatus Nitrosotalea sp.]
MTPIERAKRLGTFNAIDRSKQYAETDGRELLRAVNEAWTKIRHCEKRIAEKDADIARLRDQISRYKIINIALTSIVTALAWEGLKALITLLR